MEHAEVLHVIDFFLLRAPKRDANQIEKYLCANKGHTNRICVPHFGTVDLILRLPFFPIMGGVSGLKRHPS